MNTNSQHIQPKNKILEINSMHTFFVLSNINFNSAIKSTISTLWCPNKPFTIDFFQLVKALSFLNIKNFLIINISENDNKDNNIQYSFQIESTTYLKFNLSVFQEFISRDDINEHLHNTLFITDNIPWSTIVYTIKESKYEVSVSGGSNNKRHLISKLNTRLLCYLLAIFQFNYHQLNFLNGFDTINKGVILPFIDYSNKKK